MVAYSKLYSTQALLLGIKHEKYLFVEDYQKNRVFLLDLPKMLETKKTKQRSDFAIFSVLWKKL